MTETEFLTLADRTLARIGSALDAALQNSDADVDWSLNDGILEIECEDGSKLIVNRHVPIARSGSRRAAAASISGSTPASGATRAAARSSVPRSRACWASRRGCRCLRWCCQRMI